MRWLARVKQSPACTRHLLEFLLVYGAALMTYALLASNWGPLHVDLTEMWAWGKEFELGYLKHPPFAAWIAGLWFTVMPRTNWSFYLLATLNGAVGLAGVWALAGLLLGPFGRWASMLVLVLTPSFTITALKFNCNAPLLSTWPWAAYFFVASLQTRRAVFGAAAGLLTAAALLTKYSSVFLLASFFFAALLHPERQRYFRSPAPYVAVAAGLAAIAPHVWWGFSTGFSTLDYAAWKTLAAAAGRDNSVRAIFLALSSLGIATGVLAMIFGAEIRSIFQRSVAGSFHRRAQWVACLAAGPFLFTIAAYLFGGVRVTSSYLIPTLYALPLAFLFTSGVEITFVTIRQLVLSIAAVWLPLLLASPLLGYWMWNNAGKAWLEPRQEIAAAATRMWHDMYRQPLRFVSGSEDLAKAVTFYSPDAPSFLLLTSPFGREMSVSEARRREGVLFICRRVDDFCVQSVNALVDERAFRYTHVFAPHFLRRAAEPEPFVFILQPPAPCTDNTC